MAEGKTITITQKGQAPQSNTYMDLYSKAYESSGTIVFVGTNGEGRFTVRFGMTIDENRRLIVVNPPSSGTYNVQVPFYTGRKCKPGTDGAGCELKDLDGFPEPDQVEIKIGETFALNVTDMGM